MFFLLHLIAVYFWLPIVHFAMFFAGEIQKVAGTPSPEPVRTDLVVSYIVVWLVALVQRSKNQTLQWISTQTPWVTRAVMAAAAALHAVGVAWTFDSGTLTITGLSLTVILTFLVSATKNYVIQHFFYQTAFRSRERFVSADADTTAAAAGR